MAEQTPPAVHVIEPIEPSVPLVGEFTMLNDAINDGLHPGPNPFAKLRLEQPRGRKDLTALVEEELQKLLLVSLAFFLILVLV